MTIQETIRQQLAEQLEPVHLEVINESFMHSVPDGSETHFKVIAVSAKFEGKSLVAQHRLVNRILADQLAGPIHALTLNTLTPNQWVERAGEVTDSPPCLGGSKADTRS
ncbi:MAG: BolA family transcriptional regulator [Gammaproteobacteria bacterium]|nr:BolA family transcriptional regulator [Gammaproteobacteria bacterium]